MKRPINIILAGVLAIPMLVLGISLVTPAAQLVSAQTTLSDGALSAKSTEQPPEVKNIFLTVTNVLLFLIGAIAVIMLIYGGFRYTTSGGDSSSVTAAKNTILYAIVGIIVAIVAYAVVKFVIVQFTGSGTPTP